MRLSVLILLSLCVTACFAKRFLQEDEEPIVVGGYTEIDLKNPPSDYLDTLAYVKGQLNSLCHINNDVEVIGVEKAFVQIVAGKNYKIVFFVQNHDSEKLTVNVFQSLPENGQTSYEVDSCN